MQARHAGAGGIALLAAVRQTSGPLAGWPPGGVNRLRIDPPGLRCSRARFV